MKLSTHTKNVFILATTLLPLLSESQELRINKGVSVTASGDVRIVLHDADLINHGLVNAGNSTFLFTGESTRPILVGGSTRTSFHNMIVDLPSARLQLENNTAVLGSLSLRNGNLELNRHQLDLGNTGVILGESTLARITGRRGGTIVTTTFFNAPQDQHPGNLGIAISSRSNLGRTRITRGHQPQTDALGKSGIERYFEITPAIPANDIELSITYLQPELNGHDHAQLVIWSGQQDGKLSTYTKVEGAGSSMNGFSARKFGAGMFTLGPGNLDRGQSKGNLRATPGGLQSAATYPNPAQRAFTLTVHSSVAMQGNILLQDQHGRVLENRLVRYRAGMNTSSWNMGEFAAGTYYLVFENMDLQPVKIVKQ